MKKLIIIFIAVLSCNALFAQQADYPERNDRRGESGNVRSRNDRDEKAYAYNHANSERQQRIDQRNRQLEIERLNRKYDRDISDYRNDRSINSFERESSIQHAERERQQKAKSFGTGLGIGAIAGLLLGVLIAR